MFKAKQAGKSAAHCIRGLEIRADSNYYFLVDIKGTTQEASGNNHLIPHFCANIVRNSYV